jgi:predicted enzyme related to lactoylglutathione lyase
MPEIKGVRQVSLVVRSFGDSVAFYRDILGFFENWMDDLGETASLNAGATEIYLMGPAAAPDPREPLGSGVTVTFLVEDLDGHFKKIVNAGLTPLGLRGQALSDPESRPNAERAFCLQDPSGYSICFLEKTPSFP